MAELMITLSDGRASRHALAGGPEVIGRDVNCAIFVDDPSASRNHARFTATPNGYLVEDLGSKNSTIVNDQPCTSHLLSDGDRVLIGSTLAVFSDPSARTHPSVVVSDDAASTHATKYVGRSQRLLLPQRRLEMIYELSERLTTVQSQSELLEGALATCFETLGFERGAIGVRRPDQRGLQWPVIRNLETPEGELTISRTLLSRALEHGERAIFTDDDTTGADPTVSILRQGIRSAMCVPLLHKDQTLGVIYGDRLSTSTVYTNEDIDFLAGIARQISIGLINAWLVEERQAMARLEHDVNLARRIQTGLFPAALPNRPDLKIAALNDPGQRVSGDYYDVIELPDGRVWCLIADVTGEGVAASLLMANLQAAVRVTIEQTHEPGVLLTQWNRLIARNTDPSKFITCLLALIDPKAHTLRLATAGHCAPLIQRRPGEAPEELAPDEASFPLGIDEDAVYETIDIAVGPESFTFFCYTDGVIEAISTDDTLYGLDRLVRLLTDRADHSPQALVKQVRKSVAGFAGSAPQSDDITMLAARVE